MGTASGAFTALFGIDFPKAIYKGNVLGLSVRAPKSVFRERPIVTAHVYMMCQPAGLRAEATQLTQLADPCNEGVTEEPSGSSSPKWNGPHAFSL